MLRPKGQPYTHEELRYWATHFKGNSDITSGILHLIDEVEQLQNGNKAALIAELVAACKDAAAILNDLIPTHDVFSEYLNLKDAIEKAENNDPTNPPAPR